VLITCTLIFFFVGKSCSQLSHNVDGILKALQVISVSVDGIVASYSSSSPFIIRGHLKADADQIANLTTTLLEASGRRLKSVAFAVKQTKSSMLTDLQQLTCFAMTLKSAAKLIISQPNLVFVENLLKQDQSLLNGHAREWLLTYQDKVLSVLSRVRGLANILQYLGPDIRSRIASSNFEEAAQGLDAFEDDLKGFSDFLFETKLVTHQFLTNASDDQLRFNTVGDILRKQILGDDGKLRDLEDRERSLSAQLSSALEEVVNHGTNMLINALEWEAVLAVSIGLGQIEFAPVEGAVFVNVVKKGANISIKKISAAGSKKAIGEIQNVNSKQDELLPIIAERGQVLLDLSNLKVDVAILHVYLQSVSDFTSNASRLLDTLGDIVNDVKEQIQTFFSVKILLKSNKEEALKMLDAILSDWKLISPAADSLEQTFTASF
jgi:hypothetical protein